MEAWSEDYGLTPQIDACVLGGGMYAGYERYWSSIQNEPDKPAWITGAAPTPAEREWASFIRQTPHYVLSSKLDSALWPNTRFVRSLDVVAALKQQSGKDIYLDRRARAPRRASSMPGWWMNSGSSSIRWSPVKEGRFSKRRSIVRGLELRKVEQLQDGKVSLVYGVS